MSAWWIAQRRAWRWALNRLMRAPLVTLLTAAVIGVTIALPLGLFQAMKAGQAASGQLDAHPDISMFLALDAQTEHVAAVRAALEQQRAVASFRFVSRDDALAELKRTSAEADVLATLERNPLPHAFVVRASDANPKALEQLAQALARLPKVENVRMDVGWAKRLAALTGIVQRLVLVLAFTFAFALVLVVAAIVRMNVLGARDEVEIVKLIGGTNRFVRRPFLYQGALHGVLGGLAAIILVGLGVRYLNAGVADFALFQGFDLRLSTPDWRTALVVLAAAGILGWLGAYLCVATQLSALRSTRER